MSGAQTAFKQYVETYPNNTLTPNAWYWLGQVQYSQAIYDQARLSFLNVARYNQSQKRPDALYKLGMIKGFNVFGTGVTIVITALTAIAIFQQITGIMFPLFDVMSTVYMPLRFTLAEIAAMGRIKEAAFCGIIFVILGLTMSALGESKAHVAAVAAPCLAPLVLVS